MIAQFIVIVAFALGVTLIYSPVAGLALGYGGIISIINNLLIIRITWRQAHIKPESPSVGFGLLIYSLITRMITVAILIYIGFLINLSSFQMIIGLCIGQVTLVINKLVTKG